MFYLYIMLLGYRWTPLWIAWQREGGEGDMGNVLLWPSTQELKVLGISRGRDVPRPSQPSAASSAQHCTARQNEIPLHTSQTGSHYSPIQTVSEKALQCNGTSVVEGYVGESEGKEEILPLITHLSLFVFICVALLYHSISDLDPLPKSATFICFIVMDG